MNGVVEDSQGDKGRGVVDLWLKGQSSNANDGGNGVFIIVV